MRKLPTVPLSGLLHDPFHPFNHPDDGERAMAYTPDVMTEEEMAAFPEYSKLVCIYVCTYVHVAGLRVQWNLSIKDTLN